MSARMSAEMSARLSGRMHTSTGIARACYARVCCSRVVLAVLLVVLAVLLVV